MKYNNDIFVNKSKIIHNNKYDYSLVEYKNMKTKVKIICPEHGVFQQRPEHHLNSHGCKICGNIKYDTNEFITTSKKIHGDKYDYSLVEYKSYLKKVKIICHRHGIFEQLPKFHVFGQGCPFCKYDNIDKQSNFIKKAKRIHGDKYNYDHVNYINSYTKVQILCLEHGLFKQNPKDHLNRQQGCPKCNISKGEEKIKLYLENNNIKYTYQKKFKNCKNKQQLSFDFYLNELNVCLEVNGKQHYETIEYYSGEETLNYNKKNDNIKKEFCNKNNNKLIIIKYNEIKKIKEILKNYVNTVHQD